MISKLSVSLSVDKSLSKSKCSQLLEKPAHTELSSGIITFLKSAWAWQITFFIDTSLDPSFINCLHAAFCSHGAKPGAALLS